jgi:hypothetical protein
MVEPSALISTVIAVAAGLVIVFVCKRFEARRELGAKMQTETRYAITSLVPNAIEILQALRLHWGIENGFQSGCCIHGRRIGNLVAQCCS